MRWCSTSRPTSSTRTRSGSLPRSGSRKGKPFAPDARMKAILTDAVAVGNATARAVTFAPRDPRQRFFTDRQWNTGFLGATHSRMAASASSMDAPCSTTTRPASRRPWRRQVRRRVGIRVHGERFPGRVARWWQELQGDASRADPGRSLLVIHGLRQPDALHARDRSGQRRSR